MGENTEKYITFSIQITNNAKKTCKLKFIDSCRFMATSLSDLVNNLSEINNKDCETCMERKIIKSKWDFIEFKNNRLNDKCKECGKRCYQSINGLIKKFPSVYKFCDDNPHKFVLLLRKGANLYEDMDS